MQGRNPQRPPVKGDGKTLEVKEIFSTLQGEGPNTGMPAVFVRLGGCNLACTFCDTEFEEFESLSVDEIVREVEALVTEDDRRLVVITGGEPMRQPIEYLCGKLLERSFKVQIETNGTLYRDLPEAVEIVCSPKNTGKGYHPIRPDLLPRINALKFLISADDPLYGDVSEDAHDIPIYVQPMDEKNEDKNMRNLSRAMDIAQARGYHLSVQTHKIWGLP